MHSIAEQYINVHNIEQFQLDKYQPIRAGGTRSPHAALHRVQISKWLLGGPKMVERRYAPRQHAPETLSPETLHPGDTMPRKTLCPGKHYAPGDTMPQDTMPRRHFAPETLCPGG